MQKVRGIPFRDGYHDYRIATGGLQVFPRLVAGAHFPDYARGPVGSGLPELDILLGRTKFEADAGRRK